MDPVNSYMAEYDHTLVGERKYGLPRDGASLDATVRRGDEGHLINIPGAERVLLLTNGTGQVVASAGRSRSATPYDRFKDIRTLAADEAGHLFAARKHEYAVDVLTATGEELGVLQGPRLNRHEILPVPFNRSDNPVPAEIVDVRAAGAYLWILLKLPKEGWESHMEDYEIPGGMRLMRIKKESTLADVYQSRVDVIELTSGTVVGRRSLAGVITGFADDNSLVENRTGADEVPRIITWGISFRAR
jgi:hypothetical protein